MLMKVPLTATNVRAWKVIRERGVKVNNYLFNCQ